MDNSKEGLMFYNKKPSFSSSFDPISEKQEEMSASSKTKNNQIKSKNSNKNLNENITKNVLDDVDIIKHSQTHKNKASWMVNNNRKSILLHINEEQQKKNSLTKSKKRIKRNSAQERGNVLSSMSLGQLNISEIKDSNKKKNSVGKKELHFQVPVSNTNNQESSITKNFSHNKSISRIVTDFNRANKKRTVLTKGRLNFNEKTTASIYDQIKNSELFEKSESLLFKLKICFAILATFSLISIILNCADSIIYNNKSIEYIKNQNNNNTFFDKNNIENYYCINKRKISHKENAIRISNAVFSLFCSLFLILIYKIKTGAFEDKKKNTKKERFKRMLDEYYNKQRKKGINKSKLNAKQKEEKDRYEKIKVVDLNSYKKEECDNKKNKIERNITIQLFIINIIFYPPYINVAFIGKYNNIIYIYSLNSFFLIISLFKISNLYRAIFYLSPLNNSFNKAICESNLLSLNSKFMFKYNLNKYPLTFLLFNFVILLIIIGILLTCAEFFSVDINNIFWSDINESKTENFLQILSLFLFFSIRNVQEDHCIKSILGKIILFIGGIIGFLISSLFVYYMNNLIEFTPEEQIAFSKLTKLLNPINREHKASNLIKSILITKKIFKENQNTVRDYRMKIEDMTKLKYFQRRPVLHKNNAFNLVFNSDGTSINKINLNEINGNEEKKKFIKFIESIFLIKIKIRVELKNFIDNLKVARNSTLSFNDVLKTVGNKMDINISQLSNKLEVLIRNDQKFIDFIKFCSNTVKKIKKISDNHNSIIQYLTDIHNDHVKQIIEIKKEAELNSPLLYKNSLNFPKRTKSNAYGNFNFKKKAKNKPNNNNEKKKKIKRDIYDFNYSKYLVKKQKSSHMSSVFLLNSILDEKIKQARSKQNTTKTAKSRNRNITNSRTKSLDHWKIMKIDYKEKIKGRHSLFKKVGRSVSVMDRNKNKKV